MTDILYIHGMGGGGDSRIPSILNGWFKENRPEIRVIIRTYSFDPEEATRQISSWYDELRPDLVIGESMGANHALALLSRRSAEGKAAFRLILVSPALGGPKYMSRLAFIARIPGMPKLMSMIYKTKPGDRQRLEFKYDSLRKWPEVIERASAAAEYRSDIHAFFGTRDHYRKSGIVSIRAWRRKYGNCSIYEGTHFMEEEHIYKKLIPAIMTGIGYDIQ